MTVGSEFEDWTGVVVRRVYWTSVLSVFSVVEKSAMHVRRGRFINHREHREHRGNPSRTADSSDCGSDCSSLPQAGEGVRHQSFNAPTFHPPPNACINATAAACRLTVTCTSARP